MENKKSISENKGLSTGTIIVIIGTIIVVFALGIISIIYREPKTFTSNPSYSPPSLPNTDSGVVNSSANSNFSQINQADKTRSKEIIMGVVQNTISVTPDIKNELRDIFKKYNATDAEINDFAIYGPAFMANYQKLFFVDALQSISNGYSVKSNERFNLEKEALSRGLATNERISANDEEMRLIANKQPVVGLDGRQTIFTVDDINNTLNSIDSITARLQSLFE